MKNITDMETCFSNLKLKCESQGFNTDYVYKEIDVLKFLHSQLFRIFLAKTHLIVNLSKSMSFIDCPYSYSYDNLDISSKSLRSYIIK